MIRWLVVLGPRRFLLLPGLFLSSLVAQPRAVLVDGSGPWRDDRWALAVAEFRGLLNDSGYSVQTASPVDLPSALGSPNLLLAVPSLERLPFEAFATIASYVAAGGGLMASGGEAFRTPLYLAPGGQWLDAASYRASVGSPPPQGPFPTPSIPTVSPAKEQYTANSGARVPIARSRGLFSTSLSDERYRVIGDLLAPAATVYVSGGFFRSFVVWLPWPQLFEPLRGQLVATLRGRPNRLSILNAGADQIVWLPGERVTGGATLFNATGSVAQATLEWSIAGAAGVTTRPSVSFSMAEGEFRQFPLEMGILANGDYTIRFRLRIGDQEADRLDSPVRVLDPFLSRQPDQKVRVVNGAFSAAGRHVFLRGVNYWPRFIAGLNPGSFNGRSWLEAAQYDPDLVEADLSEIASLHFNLVNIQFSDYEGFWAQEGRALIDFLERCRNHDIRVQVALRTTLLNGAYAGQLSPTLDSYLQAAYLPGNDRVFAYELLWEPMVGMHDQGGQGRIVDGAIVYNKGRQVLDPDWQTWVNEQYGSAAEAEKTWGVAAPRDAAGQLTNPLDDQIQNDGPWRILVAAYRRFLDDYIGRNLGVIARRIRRSDPDTLLTYRNWITMTPTHNAAAGYDIGTGAAHLDFFSPERYSPAVEWPDVRAYGLATAYSRYRSGGKPVMWAEFGADVGGDGGTPASRSGQAAICDGMMRLVADDRSNAASVWWWPGGYAPMDGSDFGIIDPDGTPRECARILSGWNTTFAAAPPDATSDPPTTLMVDRDADARGAYGLFLNFQERYVQARQARQSVALADAGTGTDTATMPIVQIGNAPYSGTGPLKFANAEFAGIRVVCPGVDVTVENGSTLPVAAGSACQATPTVVNTGEARWIAGSASRGVTLRTNAGDATLAAPLGPLERTTLGALNLTIGQSAMAVTGRLRIDGVGDFGELLNVTLTPDPTASGACALSLSPSGTIPAPASGENGMIRVTAPAGCAWTASSSDPWVTVAPAAGSGNGAVSYTVQPGYGPARQGTISVAGRPITVMQDGVVNAPMAQTPSLSPASLSFGRQTLGGSGAAQPVRLTNTSGGALQIGAIAIGGLNSGDFSQSNGCGATLAAGDSCTIQVSFIPTAAGTRTALLYVSGNIGGGRVVASLSGEGAGTGPAPAVQAIVDSWGYTAGIAPGLWVTITGANLGGAPQTWNLSGIQTLPAALGGVAVTFNGTPAALLYTSGNQVNALVPAGVPPGKIQVVTQVNGVDSAPFTVTAAPAQPAVYAPPNADASTFFVTAALAGTATLVGNPATDPRVARAVFPGDTIDLYMIGLGATSDPLAFLTDRVFSGAFPVSAAVAATVGGKAAQVLFAGLTAPGLYLVRIVVPPDVSAGAQPLQVSAGDAKTRASLALLVAPRN